MKLSSEAALLLPAELIETEAEMFLNDASGSGLVRLHENVRIIEDNPFMGTGP